MFRRKGFPGWELCYSEAVRVLFYVSAKLPANT